MRDYRLHVTRIRKPIMTLSFTPGKTSLSSRVLIDVICFDSIRRFDEKGNAASACLAQRNQTLQLAAT